MFADLSFDVHFLVAFSSSFSSSSSSSSYLVLSTDLVSRSIDASTAEAHRPTDRLRVLLLCPMSHVRRLMCSVVGLSRRSMYTPWKCRLTSPQHTRACNTIHWYSDAPVLFGSIAPAGPCIAHPPAARRRTRAPLRLPPSVRRASQPRMDACIGTARPHFRAR